MLLRKKLKETDDSTAVIQAQFAKEQKSQPQFAEIDHNDIVQKKFLGAGMAAEIFLGTYKNEQVVIKAYKNLGAVGKSYFIQEKDAFKASFPSQYIVRPVGYSTYPYIILMEYAENGALGDYLEEHTLTFEQMMEIVNDVALGLLKLLEVGLVHRDIKTTNILLTKDLRAKICDFNDARNKDLASPNESVGFKGTLDFMAPEYYYHSPFSSVMNLPAADVFSFGMFLIDLFVNHSDDLFSQYKSRYEGDISRLYNRSEPKARLALLQNMIKTSDLSKVPELWRDDIKKIIASCLEENPEERSTMHVIQRELQNIVTRLKQPQELLLPQPGKEPQATCQDEKPVMSHVLAKQSILATEKHELNTKETSLRKSPLLI